MSARLMPAMVGIPPKIAQMLDSYVNYEYECERRAKDNKWIKQVQGD
jgi:hypothetical protein